MDCRLFFTGMAVRQLEGTVAEFFLNLKLIGAEMFGIAIHGGAGTLKKALMTPETEERSYNAL